MRKRKLRVWQGILIALLILILLCILGVYLLIQHYYSKSNFISDDEVSMYMTKDDEEDNEEETNGDKAKDETEEATLSSEEESKLISEQEAIDIADVPTEGVYNILLIGTDRRDSSWWGNSDSMILMSINYNTKKITLVSFMRDLYANIENVGVRKLNNAYARGGGPLLCSTITANYGVHIDNYASVDFVSMASIIDILGGVDVDMYQAEVDYLNQGTNWNLFAGVNHLNGEQAVAYARIRYVGYYDYERTERQRKILGLIFEKAKTMNVFSLNEIANSVLPYITHNIEQVQLLELMTQLPNIVSFEMVTDRVPYDGLYTNMGEILVPDFEATISRLRSTLYQ
ncbi:MAG: LCP family protein [Lachnospiraceae bacterium]